MKKREVLYKKIYLDLLNKIQTHEYKVNDVLPTEVELLKAYGVSRPTIRQAIALLVDDGLVYRKKKAGTIVFSNKIVQQFTNQIRSFDSEMLDVGMIPKTKVLSLQEVPETSDLRLLFSSLNKDPYYELVRVRYAKKDPIVLVRTIVSNLNDNKFTTIDFENNSLYDYLCSIKSEVVKVKRVLEVEVADQELSEILEISEKDPVFVFTSYGYSKDNILLEYSIAKYRGDLNSFIIDIDTQRHPS